jgi:transposase
LKRYVNIVIQRWDIHMKRFIQGEDRTQSTLLPEALDDYITENNPVRVIDVYVDNLDLGKLAFAGVEPEVTGRPAYHPATLLKLYIYGYLNRIQSTRRLEIETQRNVELMWLTSRLMPDFKTIVRFRKDNGKAIRSVCKQFVQLCREPGLFAQAIVAIDGSKFKAVNGRDSCYTQAKIKYRIKQVEDSINQYLAALDRADKQITLTDPDARFMATRQNGSGMVSYNVQSAVDTKHHLIVAHEVTNISSDRSQLANMAHQAGEAMGTTELTALADRGYYKGEEILACDEAGIMTFVPKPQTPSNQAEGLFDKRDFTYVADKDEYRCPAGQSLRKRFTTIEEGKTLHAYYTTVCQSCSLKNKCTTGKERRVKRWEHETVLDAMQSRLDVKPDAMLIRKQTVEHPFGTIKARMGCTHFLTKTLDRVSTEMSLHVLAYNLKRVIKIMGSGPLIEAMRA